MRGEGEPGNEARLLTARGCVYLVIRVGAYGCGHKVEHARLVYSRASQKCSVQLCISVVVGVWLLLGTPHFARRRLLRLVELPRSAVNCRYVATCVVISQSVMCTH